ncbi:AAC(3) family N-acetyltransferase [Cyanobium sp. FGCU-6]|nr:AAC(3) family N-acetyltransferase [Cyanobium sp. FGCU6]
MRFSLIELVNNTSIQAVVNQLQRIGLDYGHKVMIHASFKAMKIWHPEILIQALEETIGNSGLIMMPALSYHSPITTPFDTLTTRSCVGYLAEYFRLRNGTLRSLHPTHSVCASGSNAHEFLNRHLLDVTPCGLHSPFNKLIWSRGKILMIGCGLKPNTTMHAIEEYIAPPYLFGRIIQYSMIDKHGMPITKKYISHDFKGYAQRYDKIACDLKWPYLIRGTIGNAEACLIDCKELYIRALDRLKADPFYFVDRE